MSAITATSRYQRASKSRAADHDSPLTTVSGNTSASVPPGLTFWYAQGAFDFAAPGSGYTIAVWLECPTGEGAVGHWVHVGEWGADGFLADTDGYLEDHQKGPEPFADGERDRIDLVIELPETRKSLVEKHCEN